MRYSALTKLQIIKKKFYCALIQALLIKTEIKYYINSEYIITFEHSFINLLKLLKALITLQLALYPKVTWQFKFGQFKFLKKKLKGHY